jgi:hypothetical protein
MNFPYGLIPISLERYQDFSIPASHSDRNRLISGATRNYTAYNHMAALHPRPEHILQSAAKAGDANQPVRHSTVPALQRLPWSTHRFHLRSMSAATLRVDEPIRQDDEPSNSPLSDGHSCCHGQRNRSVVYMSMSSTQPGHRCRRYLSGYHHEAVRRPRPDRQSEARAACIYSRSPPRSTSFGMVKQFPLGSLERRCHGCSAGCRYRGPE